MNFIFTLEEIGLRDASWVGEEAANLGELLKIGAHVPATFVVPTTSYAEYLNYPKVKTILGDCESINAEELKTRLISASLPPVLERSLRTSYRVLSGPQDTLVSMRTGTGGQKVIGEEKLIYTVKNLWAEHLVRLCSLKEGFSLNPLPILVQQIEMEDLEGRVFTSDPYSFCGERSRTITSGTVVIEVDHLDGKERFFLEKGTDKLTKRFVTGVVKDIECPGGEASLELVSSLSSWATKIEKLLGSPQELGWTSYSPEANGDKSRLAGRDSYRGTISFFSVKPLYLKKTVPAAVKLWVQIESTNGSTLRQAQGRLEQSREATSLTTREAVPDEVEGAIVALAESAVSLAERLPAKPVLLMLNTVDEKELAVIRRARHKRRQRNLHLVLPPVRTVDGLREIKREIAGEGLPRGPNLKFYFRASFPANIVVLDRFLELEIDGVIFDAESLTQGFLGTREAVEPDDSLLWAVDKAQKECQEAGVELLYLADAISEELLADLIRQGVSRIAIPTANEEAFLSTLATVEAKRLAGEGNKSPGFIR